MNRLAIISDIHGNLHALQAVLARIATMDVNGIVCLGDIVGYGPFPERCLDLVVRHCAVIVQGNHDEAVVVQRATAWWMTGDPEQYQSGATRPYIQKVLRLYQQAP